MARRIVETLTDDVDGSLAAETVTFGLDGLSYEIDLKEENAADLRHILAPYISVARPLGTTRDRTGRAARSGS